MFVCKRSAGTSIISSNKSTMLEGSSITSDDPSQYDNGSDQQQDFDDPDQTGNGQGPAEKQDQDY